MKSVKADLKGLEQARLLTGRRQFYRHRVHIFETLRCIWGSFGSSSVSDLEKAWLQDRKNIRLPGERHAQGECPATEAPADTGYQFTLVEETFAPDHGSFLWMHREEG